MSFLVSGGLIFLTSIITVMTFEFWIIQWLQHEDFFFIMHDPYSTKQTRKSNPFSLDLSNCLLIPRLG